MGQHVQLYCMPHILLQESCQTEPLAKQEELQEPSDLHEFDLHRKMDVKNMQA